MRLVESKLATCRKSKVGFQCFHVVPRRMLVRADTSCC